MFLDGSVRAFDSLGKRFACVNLKLLVSDVVFFFFFQAEDGIRDRDG